MREYATNEQFDYIKAMSIIPEEFMVDESKNEIYDFLKLIICHQLHEKRVNTCN